MENTNMVRMDEKVLANKVEAWGKIGKAFYENEIQLQAEAQAAIIAIKTPKNIADVVAFGEPTLKQLKSAQKIITEKRKAITDRLRTPMERLMLAEKSLEAPIEELTKVILLIKKDHEKKQAEEQAKQNEIKRVREQVKKYLADQIAYLKTKIIDQITFAHKWALENNVTKQNKDEYVLKVSDKFKVTDFAITHPAIKSSLDSNEVTNIINEILICDANEFIEEYRTLLKDKFEFFEIDLLNKAQSLATAEEENKKAAKNIEETKDNQQLVATFETLSTSTDTITSEVKALKKTFKVDMEDNLNNALLIITAFASNIELTSKKLRVSKYMNLSVGQMAETLAKIKSEDDKFTVTGIIFVEENKL